MKAVNLKLPRVSPSEAGLDANAVLDFLDAAEEAGLELHSLMVAIDGKVAAEGWWEPYAAPFRHGCYSGTKTFTSAAVGFAIDEGLMKESDTLISFFPEKVKPGQDANLPLVTIRDLLCMACGQDGEVDLTKTDDAVALFLDAKIPHRPGTIFQYNSVASHMLGEVIYRKTGKTLPEYLQPRLFAPLGITDVRWDRTPQGHPMGGWGIHLRTEDYLKLGILFLQHGVWNGKQVLPRDWAERAPEKQIENATADSFPEWSQGYCYQMWRNVTPDSFRLDGAYGQLCCVYPDRGTAIAITSGVTDTKTELDLIRDVLLKGIKGKPLHQPQADLRLAGRLAQLSLREKGCVCRSALETEFRGKTIVFEKNEDSLIPKSQRGMAFLRENGIERASLRFFEHVCLLSWREGSYSHTVKIGLDGDYAVSDLELPFADDPIFAVGHWEGNAFRFVLRTIEAPHALQGKLTIEGDDVCLAYFDTLGQLVNGWRELHGNLLKEQSNA